MYQAHWGLRDDPFRNCVDPRRFFRCPATDEALARLHFLVEGGWRLGLVLGPSGIGKSMLAEVFAGELRRQAAQVARLHVCGLEPVELLWHLAAALGLAPTSQEPAMQLWRSIGDRLVENRYQRIKTVVIVDDLDRANPQVREQMVRLLHAGDSPEDSLSVIATGQAADWGRLGRLLELVDLRIDLPPWTVDETDEYLRDAVRQAGCQRSLFNREAIERIHALSRGIPRRINQLAEMGVLAGAANELRQIDADTVEAVDSEFSMSLADASLG